VPGEIKQQQTRSPSQNDRSTNRAANLRVSQQLYGQ